MFERKTDYGNKAGECTCHGLCGRDAKIYIDYAMSVIISGALPDVRDGLKPVQRRTLYDMYELGIRYDRPYRKVRPYRWRYHG